MNDFKRCRIVTRNDDGTMALSHDNHIWLGYVYDNTGSPWQLVAELPWRDNGDNGNEGTLGAIMVVREVRTGV